MSQCVITVIRSAYVGITVGKENDGNVNRYSVTTVLFIMQSEHHLCFDITTATAVHTVKFSGLMMSMSVRRAVWWHGSYRDISRLCEQFNDCELFLTLLTVYFGLKKVFATQQR